MPNKLPILFVRYAPGASGNFLISLLQISNQISCWNTEVENTKNTDNFNQHFCQWFDYSFQEDLENHLKYEPHHPYKLDFISAKHPRGDNLTVEEFVQELEKRNDYLFLNNIERNALTVMRLNKTQIPKFGHGATVINIIVDKTSRDIFYAMRMKKLFGREDQYWISKENHPEFLRAKFNKVMFNNPYKFNLPKDDFVTQYVIDRPYTKLFDSIESITHGPGNNQVTHLSINLSDLLSENIYSSIEKLFCELGLETPNRDIVKYCYNRYYQTNIKPFLNEI